MTCFINRQSKPKRTVSSEHFCRLIELNMSNEKLSDHEFREFIRNTLPIVEYEPMVKEDKS